MAQTISRRELIDLIEARIKKHGTQRAAAKSMRISQAALSDILHGRRSCGPKVLRALGYEEETTYRKINA